MEGKELGQAMIALKAQLRWRDGVPELCTDDHVADRIPALDEQTVEHIILPWTLQHWEQAVEEARRVEDQQEPSQNN